MDDCDILQFYLFYFVSFDIQKKTIDLIPKNILQMFFFRSVFYLGIHLYIYDQKLNKQKSVNKTNYIHIVEPSVINS